jgi:hypothetical protein
MDSEVTNLAQVKAFDSTDYATSAQGTLADSALQSGDNISSLTNDAGYITSATTELSSDTTPQLGGLLDTNGHNIEFGDSTGAEVERLKFGVGDDLQLYHDGNNSYVRDVGTGDLIVQGTNIRIRSNDAENMIVGTANGAVNLYYDATSRFVTTSTGVSISGDIGVSGTVDGRDVASDGTKLDGIESSATANPNALDNLVEDTTPQLGGNLYTNGNRIFFGDSSSGTDDRLCFGASNDLQIYHSGTASWISETGTGNLYIQGSNLILEDSTGGNFLYGTSGGAVTLYFNNASKFSTQSTGVDVTGTITADGLDMDDNHYIKLGASDDLQIWHDGSNSAIRDTGTGDLYIQGSSAIIFQDNTGSETFARFNDNSSCQLYYDNSQKFATTSTGVAVTGRATGTQTTDNDGNFNLQASNHFVCTPTANFTLTFTNHTAGQAGTIVLKNTGGYTVSAHADTLVMGADLLTTISTAGTYVLGFISDGTDTRIYNSGAEQ